MHDQPVANIYSALKRVKERSTVSFEPHDLRRTAASQMTSLGIGRLVVSKVLNHAERGVTAGDFVTVALPNSSEFLEAVFAIWKLGAVPQPVSARLPRAEREAILERAKPSLIVGLDPDSYGATPCIPLGFGSSGYDAGALPDITAPHRQALASGGSTGTPKVIVDVLPAEIDPAEPFYGITPGRKSLLPGPLYHAGPFLNSVITASRADSRSSPSSVTPSSKFGEPMFEVIITTVFLKSTV